MCQNFAASAESAVDEGGVERVHGHLEAAEIYTYGLYYISELHEWSCSHG